MRITTTTSALLLSTLLLVPACDEVADEAFIADEVSERCFGAGCSSGPIGNTSRIGDHELSNMSVLFGGVADNTTAFVETVEAFGFTAHGDLMKATKVAVDDDGELRLYLQEGGWIAGKQLKDAVFTLKVSPKAPKSVPIIGHLRIAEVSCDPGLEDPSMTICAYEFVTDVKPADTTAYPMHEKYFGYYHTCPMDDEGGGLSKKERFNAVLSPQSALISPPDETPYIGRARATFINGCLNGAVSKGQYYLNAFYDPYAYRGLDPSQRTAMLLMWMAWFDGKSQTQPGKKIWPHDPIGGLFSWTSDPNWDVEAGYGAEGATCRGTGPGIANGLHRNFVDPVINLTNWKGLPECTAAELDPSAVLGVKVARTGP